MSGSTGLLRRATSFASTAISIRSEENLSGVLPPWIPHPVNRSIGGNRTGTPNSIRLRSLETPSTGHSMESTNSDSSKITSVRSMPRRATQFRKYH